MYLQLSSENIAEACQKAWSVVLTLNVVLDFFRTAVNLFAGQCALLDASGKMGMISDHNGIR